MRIHVKEATVKTANVEVKVLAISGRQVTMSVFRQLSQEELLSATASYNGLPWGRVNYFWGKCVSDEEHLHIVWQKGNELRRDCVWPRTNSHLRTLKEKFEDVNSRRCRFVTLLAVSRMLYLNKFPENVQTIKDAAEKGWSCQILVPGMPPGTDASGRLSFHYEGEQYALRNYLTCRQPEFYKRDALRELQAELGTYPADKIENTQGLAQSSCVETLRIKTEHKELLAKHTSRFAELEQLDQLFVAV